MYLYNPFKIEIKKKQITPTIARNFKYVLAKRIGAIGKN